MPKPIVVVGSVNLDLVCTAERIPVPGETVSGTNFQTFPGGKGANQAVAVARLGYPVSMVAKVGDDEFGNGLRNGLQEAGVDVRKVATAKRTASGVALISLDRKGQNSITVVPGANGKLLPRDLEKALPLLRSAGMILAQLEVPIETVEYLSAAAHRLQVPLMLDPAPARQLPGKLLRQVAYLTPNESETCTLCNLNGRELNAATVAEFAQHLQSMGATNVIIKMGKDGAYVVGVNGLRKMVPAFKVKAVDSTAAGDAFNGGLAVALMRGKSLDEAARFGAAVAALSVTRMGAQPAMPTAREVASLLKRHEKVLLRGA